MFTNKQVKKLMYHDKLWLKFAHTNDGSNTTIFEISAKLFRIFRSLKYNFFRLEQAGKYPWIKE